MKEQTIARINTIVAITIAALTLFSGLLGWQLGNVNNEIAKSYALAQRAELNQQKVISANRLIVNENLRSFLEYKGYFNRFNLLTTELEKAKLEDPPNGLKLVDLDNQREEMLILYLAKLKLFPNKFITRDGEYNVDEQLGQLVAADSRKIDLNPDAHLADAAENEAQAQSLQYALIALAVSLFLFAIASTVPDLNRIMYIAMVASGYISGTVGIVNGMAKWN